MKKQTSVIHDNLGGVFDCSCVVDVTMDGTTVGMEFPQLARDDDNVGPMAYVSMDGTRLKVSLTDRDDVQVSFAWDERGNRWVQEENER